MGDAGAAKVVGGTGTTRPAAGSSAASTASAESVGAADVGAVTAVTAAADAPGVPAAAESAESWQEVPAVPMPAATEEAVIYPAEHDALDMEGVTVPEGAAVSEEPGGPVTGRLAGGVGVLVAGAAIGGYYLLRGRKRRYVTGESIQVAKV